MSFFHNGMLLQPESVKICVLYDPKDGRIVHTHEVVTLPGGRRVEDREVEERARQLAVAKGKDIAKLKTLHVSPSSFDRASPYKVDIKLLTLVKLERARGKGKRASGHGATRRKTR